MLRRLGRKGDEDERGLSTIIEIGLVIVGFLGVIALLVYLMNSGSEAAKDVACRDSVIVRGKASLEVFGKDVFNKATPIICTPTDKGELTGTREEIKTQVAELTARCWFRFAEGSISNVFKNPEDKSGCRPCFYFRIPKDMDLGTVYSQVQFPQDTIASRTADKITAAEMYNFLAVNEYNPSLVRGGGTRTYLGDSALFTHTIVLPDPQKRYARDINELPIGGVYYIDYSGVLQPDDQKRINDVGKEFLTLLNTSILVVIADEFDNNDMSAARRIIENANMNSKPGSYDAVLFMVDLSDNTDKSSLFRIHMGRDLEYVLNEYDISQILQDHIKDKKFESREALSSAIAGTVMDFRNKALGPGLPIINPKSYYSYISNSQSTFSFIQDMDSDTTYAVNYMSSTDEVGWLQGIIENPGSTLGTAVAVGIGGAIAYFGGAAIAGVAGTITGIKGGIILFGAGTGVSGWIQSKLGVDIKQGVRAWMGEVTKSQPNYITIVKAQEVAQYCTIS